MIHTRSRHDVTKPLHWPFLFSRNLTNHIGFSPSFFPLQNASIISKSEKNPLNLDAKLVICGTIHFPKRTHNLFNCSYVIHSICFSKILNSFCIWSLETFFSSNSNIIKAQNQKCIITIIIIIHHKLDLSIVWIWSSWNKQNTFR